MTKAIHQGLNEYKVITITQAHTSHLTRVRFTFNMSYFPAWYFLNCIIIQYFTHV